MASFRLNPLAARWLRADAPEASAGETTDWDAWLLRRMSRRELVEVGDVWVDLAVLRQRFACVADRCAPGRGRGRARSCCADAVVSLSRQEDARLAKHGEDLLAWLEAREPRLAGWQGTRFYRGGDEPDGRTLARPGGRCVFSQLDQVGRIRCRLHAYARHAGVDRATLQPLSCRLFPLIVVDRGGGRVVLTVVARHTRRLVGTHPAGRYPCLSDAALPPLHRALRRDLDWLFGAGFARALARAAGRPAGPRTHGGRRG